MTLIILIAGIWIDPSDLQMAAGVMVLASHTMPDFITPVFSLVVKWSILPTLACALWGAKISPKSFRLNQLGGVVLGLLVGMLVVIPLTAPVIASLIMFGPAAGIGVGVLGCVAGGWSAFEAARLSRPKATTQKDEVIG